MLYQLSYASSSRLPAAHGRPKPIGIVGQRLEVSTTETDVQRPRPSLRAGGQRPNAMIPTLWILPEDGAFVPVARGYARRPGMQAAAN
jgi:hypothetical protein